MKTLLFLLLCCFGNAAQAQFNFGVGTLVYLDANAYQWYQRPFAGGNIAHYSVGQVGNIIPGVGGGVWVGNSNRWLLIAEGRAEYYPYSINLGKKVGMGALSLATLTRWVFPLSANHGVSPYFAIGGGVQWNKTQLYLPPSNTPFFVTYVGELGAGLGSGWGRGSDNSTRILGVFLRGGFSARGGVSINMGVRIGNIFGTKKRDVPPLPPRPKEPTFQT